MINYFFIFFIFMHINAFLSKAKPVEEDVIIFENVFVIDNKLLVFWFCAALFVDT